MSECVADPLPEDAHAELHRCQRPSLREGSTATYKLVLLAQLVQLGVAIQHARADELVENTEHDGREDGEEHVVERERPRFLEDLARKRVLE